MGDEKEITEDEYNLIKRSRNKQERVKRQDRGKLNVPGEYLGPWAGYSGMSSEKEAKEKLRRFTTVVNKHCLEEGKEITRSFGMAALQKSLSIKKYDLEDSYDESKIYNEHRREITNLKFLSVYNGFLSSSLDGKVNLFSLGDYEGLLKTFLGHSKGISFLDSHRSDSLLCTGSYDKTFKIWNLTTSGKFLYKYNCEEEVLTGTGGSNDEFYLGCSKGIISKVDLRVKDKIEDIRLFTKVNPTSLSSNIMELGVKKLIRLDDNKILFNLYGGSCGIVDCRKTNDYLSICENVDDFIVLNNQKVLLINKDLFINEFNYETNSSIDIMQLDDKPTSNMFSFRSKILFTTENGFVRGLDPVSKIYSTICTVKKNVKCISFNDPLGSYFVTGDIGGKITLYKSRKHDHSDS